MGTVAVGAVAVGAVEVAVAEMVAETGVEGEADAASSPTYSTRWSTLSSERSDCLTIPDRHVHMHVHVHVHAMCMPCAAHVR